MGTGLNLQYLRTSAYVAHSRQIAAAYENAKFHFVNPIDTEVYASNPRAYNIHDFGYYDEYWRRLIYYDGPGGIQGAWDYSITSHLNNNEFSLIIDILRDHHLFVLNQYLKFKTNRTIGYFVYFILLVR
jgi:hypothetical protein